MHQKVIGSVVLFLLCSNFIVVISDTTAASQDGDYTYSVNSGFAIITKYTGAGGEITIPSSLGGHPTGGIGDEGFFDCDTILSVTIPDTVTTIGLRAFASCSSLTSVTIGSGVILIATDVFTDCISLLAIHVDEANRQYASITGVLYNNAITTLLRYPCGKIGEVSIPSSVTTIATSSFSDCSELTAVTLPESITTIQNNAFDSCTSLTSLTFLALAAPTTVGSNWIQITPPELRGHAYATSNFPGPGDTWNGLTMGAYIIENTPPVFGLPSPTNSSTENPLSFTWSIPINDQNGDTFSWTIQCSNTQHNSGTTATNGTKSLSLAGLTSFTTYYVWVNATDPTGSGWYTRKWFTFTTQDNNVNTPPVFSNPSPANSSTGNPTSRLWSISINDPEGDSINWWIQCNNGQANSGMGASNGTQALTLSSLSSATTYTIWVNATDPDGSTQWTRRWYTFTTVPSSGDPSNLNAQNPTSSAISLSWTKGSTSDYTMIRRSTSGYPSSPTSGTQAYYGTGTSTTDSSLSTGQLYYYRAWAYSSSTDQYSSGYTSDSQYTLPGTPSNLNADTPTANTIRLSWSKGTGSEYTMIRRSTGSYPSSPTSGTQAYYGTGTSATDSDLSPGTYYYRAWARDSNSNYYSSGYAQDYETIPQPIQSPPIFKTPFPANLSTTNPINMTWSIPITDPDGNTFSWTIQCNNTQKTNATSATNGTKSLSLSGLTYSTTYTIWVNATDPTGSGNYTRNWYTFTTKNSGDIDRGGDDDAQIPNKKPIAKTSAGEPYHGFINTELLFNGSASYDPDGTITQYEWNFGDNTTATNATPTHTYQKEGNYTVTLTVTDNNGTSAQHTTYALITMKPNHPPNQPYLTGPTQGTITTQYNLTIYATDSDNDTIFCTIHWRDNTNITVTNVVPSGTTIPVTHQWTTPGVYTITAYTTDRNNATSETSELTILINTHYVNSIGCLIDTQNDGTYDTFYSNTTGESTLLQYNNNSYLIDTNNDGNIDYHYNISTGELTDYTAAQPTHNPLPSTTVILFAASAVIILITLALVANRKRKKQAPTTRTLEEETNYFHDKWKIDTSNVANVSWNKIQQKINQPSTANILLNEIQPQVDALKTDSERFRFIQPHIDTSEITPVHFKELSHTIDSQNITNSHLKEIEQKIDELFLNNKESSK